MTFGSDLLISDEKEYTEHDVVENDSNQTVAVGMTAIEISAVRRCRRT